MVGYCDDFFCLVTYEGELTSLPVGGCLLRRLPNGDMQQEFKYNVHGAASIMSWLIRDMEPKIRAACDHYGTVKSVEWIFVDGSGMRKAARC